MGAVLVVAYGVIWPVASLRTTSFGGYWAVARAWWTDKPLALLYDDRFLADWLHALGFALPERMLGPPPLVLTMVPLGWLPYATARAIWLWAVLLPALVLGLTWATRRLSPRMAALVATSVLLSPAVASGLEVGQVYPLYLLLHLGALASLDAPGLYGLLLAPMLLTRGWLGLPLAVGPLLAGRWRPLLATAIATALLGLLTLPLLGLDAWLAFFDQLTHLVVSRPGIPAIQSVPSLAWHLTCSDPFWGPDPPLPLRWLQPWLVGLGWALVGLAALSVRRSRPSLFAVLVLAELLLSPFTQDYQWVLAVIPVAVALERGNRTLALLGLLWLVLPVDFHDHALWGGWRSLLAYPRVWAGLCLLGSLTTGRRRP